MSCNHHPGADILLQYASGKLTGSLGLMVSLHAQVCGSCKAAIAEIESIGGQMIEELDGAAVASGSFDTILARIAQTDTESIQPMEQTFAYSSLVKKVLLGGEAGELNWQWRTKRFAELPLPTNDDNFEAKLIYFKKGMKVPRHTHKDKEYTLVLSGAFSDESGLYKRGDYICKSKVDEHTPYAESDCVCLAITTEPLKFTGTMGPVLNWFFN
ncbi:ChrR family anti-sigma-E factor [Pleionea sediminis]|uniref:ChrR family anti-sigma-E factor n=1 Tax=Pleionea sediminis TaxID=2569479 RepID=UPI0011872A4B|nr:ChrR family anti-sigma-E factor [Pleionea sediminis]